MNRGGGEKAAVLPGVPPPCWIAAVATLRTRAGVVWLCAAVQDWGGSYKDTARSYPWIKGLSCCWFCLNIYVLYLSDYLRHGENKVIDAVVE